MVQRQDAILPETEVTTQKDTTVEHHPLEKIRRETTSPVEVSLKDIPEVFPENIPEEDGPVGGDGMLEGTSELVPRVHSLEGDMLSTITEDPTIYHPVSTSNPPTPKSQHSVAEIPSSPPAPQSVVENRHCFFFSPPEGIEIEPVQAEATALQEMISEEMITEKTTTHEIITPEIIAEDTVMGEAIPEEVGPEDMFMEEASPAERVPGDMIMEEDTLEEMIIEEATPAEMATAETIPAALSEIMEVDQDARDTALAVEMQADQGNGNTLIVQPPPASWYTKPLQHKGAKRFIVADHYSEQCCRDKRRGGDQANQQALYPRDVNLDRFQAEVRLFPPIRLQLMLEGYVAARVQELSLGPARMERHYLERLLRTPEQNDRDYSFDTCWRNYAASRPHGQREPPFTLDEAITLITSCLAATLPNDSWLVRQSEHDFREELLKEVQHRHRELHEMSWSSSWVCPRRNPPHLEEDPVGQIQRFSRDYARQFLYYVIDKENLRSSYFREGGGTDAKYWIDGVRRRSDFISIRDPQTPWCLRRENNFQLLATWSHDDKKDCRDFIRFTNLWFGECIASGTSSEAARIKFGRFDKDRCDWLRHYAGFFPQKKQ